MIDADLDAALRAWGHAQVNRYVYRSAPGERTGNHPLRSAMDVAPGTRERALARLRPRDGRSRREWMARDLPDRQIVPMWACDPVTARDDGDRPHDTPEVAHDAGIPDDLRWIDDAIARLRRVSPLTAAVLVIEYTATSRAGQAVRARMVSEQTGTNIQTRRYKSELAVARIAIATLAARHA